VSIGATRIGPESAPNTVSVIEDDRFTFSSCRIGFPIATRTTLADNQVLVACVIEAEPGSRWCEIDLEPGSIVVYAPGAEHVAINRPGVGFAFVTLSKGQLGEEAERLGLNAELPRRGTVHQLGPHPVARSLQDRFSDLSGASTDQTSNPTGRELDEALRLTAEVLSADATHEPVRIGLQANRRLVVTDCIEYAESLARVPSIRELCVAVNVSERTLRRAFCAEFDLPPSQFFRKWALGEANRRLRSGGADAETVSSVAWDLGFSGLGRFASEYRSLFGELPSATLRSHRPRVG